MSEIVSDGKFMGLPYMAWLAIVIVIAIAFALYYRGKLTALAPKPAGAA